MPRQANAPMKFQWLTHSRSRRNIAGVQLFCREKENWKTTKLIGRLLVLENKTGKLFQIFFATNNITHKWHNHRIQSDFIRFYNIGVIFFMVCGLFVVDAKCYTYNLMHYSLLFHWFRLLNLANECDESQHDAYVATN